MRGILKRREREEKDIMIIRMAHGDCAHTDDFMEVRDVWQVWLTVAVLSPVDRRNATQIDGKPPYSYASLISFAINRCVEGRM